MVLGKNAALEMIEEIPDAECYLIIAQADTLYIETSSNWQK
jgi:hypothetical protein